MLRPMNAPQRVACSVPGCDNPDGASWRYGNRLCDFHGKMLADFDRWIDSDQFLTDLASMRRISDFRRGHIARGHSSSA